jgi:phage-related minor tail protein
MSSVINQGQNIKDKAKDTMAQMADKASDVANKVSDKAGQVAEKAGDVAHKVADKASQFASAAGDKASQYASAAGDKANSAVESVGSSMKGFAGTVRENLPNKGMLGDASESVAGALESGGRYLEEKGLSGIGSDVTDLIKRNPVPAVLLALGLGYLIARSTRS